MDTKKLLGLGKALVQLRMTYEFPKASDKVCILKKTVYDSQGDMSQGATNIKRSNSAHLTTAQ